MFVTHKPRLVIQNNIAATSAIPTQAPINPPISLAGDEYFIVTSSFLLELFGPFS